MTTLVVFVPVWASALTHTVGSGSAGKETIPTPKGSAASFGVIPAIVTDYTHDGTAAPTTLCTQLSPTPDVVTVETPDGGQIVLSAKTGSVLSAAQATLCQK